MLTQVIGVIIQYNFAYLQERRITPGEALNHAFVTLAHLVDYAHCNNVKASVQMMEVNIVYIIIYYYNIQNH